VQLTRQRTRSGHTRRHDTGGAATQSNRSATAGYTQRIHEWQQVVSEGCLLAGTGVFAAAEAGRTVPRR